MPRTSSRRVLWLILGLVGFAPRSAPQAPPDAALAFTRSLLELTQEALAAELGDVDQDGRLDLVVLTQSAESRELQFLKGRGTGWFEQPRVSEGPEGAVHLGLADVDDDADLDAITLTGQVLALQRFDGQGGFGPAEPLFKIAGSAQDLAVGDVTGDGRADIVATDAALNVVWVWRATGGGGFQLLGSMGVGEGPRDVDLEDVDGDGLSDIVVGTIRRVTVFLARGGGVFTPPIITQAVDSVPTTTLALADLGSDGKLDLVAGGRRFVGNGQGSFFDPLDLGLAFNVLDLELMDVSGDGVRDVVAAEGTDLTVAMNAGNGAAFVTRTLLEHVDPQFLARGDLDGDGLEDLVAVDGAHVAPLVRVPGGGFFGLHTAHLSLTYVSAMHFGDVDGDGHADLVRSGSYSIEIERGLGDGSFAPATMVFPPFILAEELALGDVDGDGRADAAVAGEYGPQIGVLWGQADGSLAAPWSAEVESSHRVDILGLVDMDADARLDVLAFQDSQVAGFEQVSLFRSDGQGGLGEQWTLPLPGRANAWDGGDVNADGDLDLIVDYISPPRISLFEGSGGGQVLAPVNIAGASGGGVLDLLLVDIDGNGTLDMLLAASDGLRVHHGIGNGDFEGAHVTPISVTPAAIVAEDMDADGDSDLVLFGSGLSILWNDGLDGSHVRFHESLPFGPSSLDHGDVADLDEDGFLDLLTVDTEPDWEFGGLDTYTLLFNALQPGWVDLGGGAAGAGAAPVLSGSGPLFPGSQTFITLSGAPARTVLLALASFEELPLAFLGGVLHPDPSDVAILFPSDAEGGFAVDVHWPSAFVSGTQVFLQCVVVDDRLPAGLSLSNALRGRSP